MGKEKRYYWLKLNEGFFGQKEIKRLRKIAGGDTYTIIYLKMLLKSLRTNGFLYFEGIESDFVSELALDIDEDEDNVEVTVNYLKSKGILVEKNADEYFLTTCDEMVGSEAASTRRSRNSRLNKALQNDGQALQCNTNATKCNTEIEIDKELELEKDKERELEGEIEKEKEVDNRVKAIIDLYQSICTSYPPLSKLTENTEKGISKSLQQYTLDDFKQVFQKAETSNFLKGENERGWKAMFGWLVQAENMAKVLAGSYDNPSKKVSKNRFNNFEQRDTDYNQYFNDFYEYNGEMPPNGEKE